MPTAVLGLDNFTTAAIILIKETTMNDETPTADNEPKPEAPMSFAEMLAQFDRVLDKMDATKLAMANMQADLRYIKGVLT